MAHAKQSAGAMRHRQIAIRHLHFWVRLTTQLPHRFDNFCDAAAIDRVVITEPAAVRVPWQLADARDQIAVGPVRTPAE